MYPPTAGLRQRKSSETRVIILDAAVDCLAAHGYANTSTQLIAKMANVSRGAMLHHYATKMDLIESVIDYAFFRHMEDFSTGIKILSDAERLYGPAGIMHDWSMFLSREYKAYLELSVAARTDEDLRAIFIPKARRHDRVWREELLRNFPEWADKTDLLDRARRLVQAVMSGMIFNREIWASDEMEAAILAFLSTLMVQIREGTLPFPGGDTDLLKSLANGVGARNLAG